VFFVSFVDSNFLHPALDAHLLSLDDLAIFLKRKIRSGVDNGSLRLTCFPQVREAKIEIAEFAYPNYNSDRRTVLQDYHVFGLVVFSPTRTVAATNEERIEQ
jgi:hypothetical protein